METRGKILIRGLWESKTDTIVVVRVGGSDCETHKKEPMKPLLDQWEKENTDKHSGNCHEKWKHLYPFVISIDGMIVREAQVVLKNLVQIDK